MSSSDDINSNSTFTIWNWNLLKFEMKWYIFCLNFAKDRSLQLFTESSGACSGIYQQRWLQVTILLVFCTRCHPCSSLLKYSFTQYCRLASLKQSLLGSKFSRNSLRGTFYGDALMELDWAVGWIMEYVKSKTRWSIWSRNLLQTWKYFFQFSRYSCHFHLRQRSSSGGQRPGRV